MIVVITANNKENKIFSQIKPFTIAQLSATVAPLAGMKDFTRINNNGIKTKTNVIMANGNNNSKARFVFEDELN
ncbi:hypothetical protein FACS1894166_05270 [Bacilli bacterium]|nr:hypothetical protein FACS1894166_05270 [Bacilli bacterium]